MLVDNDLKWWKNKEKNMQTLDFVFAFQEVAV